MNYEKSLFLQCISFQNSQKDILLIEPETEIYVATRYGGEKAHCNLEENSILGRILLEGWAQVDFSTGEILCWTNLSGGKI
jgi:hypothetical protein